MKKKGVSIEEIHCYGGSLRFIAMIVLSDHKIQ